MTNPEALPSSQEDITDELFDWDVPLTPGQQKRLQQLLDKDYIENAEDSDSANRLAMPSILGVRTMRRRRQVRGRALPDLDDDTE